MKLIKLLNITGSADFTVTVYPEGHTEGHRGADEPYMEMFTVSRNEKGELPYVRFADSKVKEIIPYGNSVSITVETDRGHRDSGMQAGDRQPDGDGREYRWKPVGEELPGNGENILVSFANSDEYDIGVYKTDSEGGMFYPRGASVSYKRCGAYVNAWMPLPGPYRE